MESEPLSRVIRTLNGADTLGAVLTGLRLGEGDQLIVVDSGSRDGTVALARSHGAELVPIRKEDFSYGRALNRGLAAARHELSPNPLCRLRRIERGSARGSSSDYNRNKRVDTQK